MRNLAFLELSGFPIVNCSFRTKTHIFPTETGVHDRNLVLRIFITIVCHISQRIIVLWTPLMMMTSPIT